MAYLKLIRSAPDGLAVRGKLYEVTYDIATNTEETHLLCPTLENADYLIPPLIYPLTVTFSPKFQRALPLVNQVPSSTAGAHQAAGSSSSASGAHQLPERAFRSGIRFHPGSKPEHSRGCILIPREAEQKLVALILGEKEVRMEVNGPSPYDNQNQNEN